MAIQAILNLPEVVRGDTMRSFLMTFKSNGTAIDLRGGNVKMQVRETKDGRLLYEADTAKQGITFIDAENGIIRIDEILRVDIKAGTYYQDIQVTLASGVRDTFTKGIWRIHEEVTK
jgi:hypothetical protein